MLQRYIANRGEREYSNQQTAERIYERNGDGVYEDRIVESVVTRETYHRAKGDPYRIEDLRSSIDPYLSIHTQLIGIDNNIINFN